MDSKEIGCGFIIALFIGAFVIHRVSEFISDIWHNHRKPKKSTWEG